MFTTLGTAITVGALLLCGQADPARAGPQEATQWARVMRLQHGSAILVTLNPAGPSRNRGFVSPEGEAYRPGRDRMRGRFLAADEDGLVLRVASGGAKGIWRIPRWAVRRIEVGRVESDPTGDGYLKGLAIGAGLAGAIYGGFAGTSEAFSPDELPLLIAFYGVPASLIGWSVDRANRDEGFVPVATVYGECARNDPALAGAVSAVAPTGWRFGGLTGVGLGLAGLGTARGTAPTFGFSAIKPLEEKLEVEAQVLASLGREETFDWTGWYYPEGPVTWREIRRADDLSAVLRLNYIVFGSRYRPYVASGIGIGWSRLEELTVAPLESGGQLSVSARSASGIGAAMLLGGGVDMALSPRWRVRPELSWFGGGWWTPAYSFGPAVTVAVTYSTGGGR